MPDPSHVHEIGRRLGPCLASVLAVSEKELGFSPLATAPVADGSTAVLVRGRSGVAAAVVLRSSPSAPQMVSRAMTRALEAKTLLGPVLGAPILDPIASGCSDGLSYAVLPYCNPLSDSRFRWWAQRARMRRPLFDWLWRLNECSARDVPEGQLEDRYVQPLQSVASLASVGDALRSTARESIARLRRGEWIPKHVLMHGDLWKGNILHWPRNSPLLPPRPGKAFAVIDWAGSVQRGYALYDLIRLAQSMRMSDRSLRLEVQRHCAVLQCDESDARGHLLAALGHIAMTLESFPMSRYVPMAEACLATLERATLNSGKRLR